MGIFDRSQLQKQIINTLVLYAFIAIIILIFLLLLKASQLSSVTTHTTSQVSLGPLDLIRIQKMPVSQGGYQATIKMLSGLMVYFGSWSALAGLTIVIKLSKSKSVN